MTSYAGLDVSQQEKHVGMASPMHGVRHSLQLPPPRYPPHALNPPPPNPDNLLRIRDALSYPNTRRRAPPSPHRRPLRRLPPARSAHARPSSTPAPSVTGRPIGRGTAVSVLIAFLPASRMIRVVGISGFALEMIALLL